MKELPQIQNDKRENPKYLSLGLKIFLGFLIIFFLWASFAPLNSSIIANGEIIPSSNKQTISHLEGGIIEEVKVKEGQFVEQNQELIILNTIQVKTKITQNIESIKALEAQKTATKKRASTLNQELQIVNELLKKANSSLTRKLDLQKQLHELEGKLGEINATIVSQKSELASSQATLERSIIKSPISGFVMDLKYQTIGGTISPAHDIMFIVPKNDKLIAEIKLNPQDIDLVHKGMIAKVQLSAYKSRLMPKLNAKVVNVSADSFKNENNGQVYFKARIEIPQSEIEKLKSKIDLTSGMPITAFIITGSRTMLQYLLTPIEESAYKAFRED